MTAAVVVVALGDEVLMGSFVLFLLALFRLLCALSGGVCCCDGDGRGNDRDYRKGNDVMMS